MLQQVNEARSHDFMPGKKMWINKEVMYFFVNLIEGVGDRKGKIFLTI